MGSGWIHTPFTDLPNSHYPPITPFPLPTISEPYILPLSQLHRSCIAAVLISNSDEVSFTFYAISISFAGKPGGKYVCVCMYEAGLMPYVYVEVLFILMCAYVCSVVYLMLMCMHVYIYDDRGRGSWELGMKEKVCMLWMCM